jgi:RNA polymerase sigma-70 factor (ECF subfamily)
MDSLAREIEELYRARYTAFRNGMVGLTGDYESARDVVQEAFARALRDRKQYRGEGSLAAWVWRIAVHAALESRRNGREEMNLDQLAAEAPPPPGDHDPELADALQQLSPRRRLLVFLHYFADLSYGEIADVCGISQGTVAATLAHARSQIETALKKEGVTP